MPESKRLRLCSVPPTQTLRKSSIRTRCFQVAGGIPSECIRIIDWQIADDVKDECSISRRKLLQDVVVLHPRHFHLLQHELCLGLLELHIRLVGPKLCELDIHPRRPSTGRRVQHRLLFSWSCQRLCRAEQEDFSWRSCLRITLPWFLLSS